MPHLSHLYWSFVGLQEGKFYNLGLQRPIANNNREDIAHNGILLGYIARANADLQAGRHSARNHLANGVTLRVANLIARARYTAVDEFQAYEFAFQTTRFEALHILPVEEIFAINKLGNPA